MAKPPGGHLPFPVGHPQPLPWLGGALALWSGCSCLVGRGEAPCPGGVCVPRWSTSAPPLPCPEPCPSLRLTLSPAPPEAEAMASKPEKRVASSVFITLAPPRRDEAVVEEVRRAACEARPGCPRESPAPTKAPGAGSAGRLRSWTPPSRAAAPVPAVPHQLSSGGKRARAAGGRPGERHHQGGEEMAGSEVIH